MRLTETVVGAAFQTLQTPILVIVVPGDLQPQPIEFCKSNNFHQCQNLLSQGDASPGDAFRLSVFLFCSIRPPF